MTEALERAPADARVRGEAGAAPRDPPEAAAPPSGPAPGAIAPAGPGGLQVLTFGCRLNARESEDALAAAAAAGLRDGIIVNSCAVTGEAVRQARQAIRRARRERPEARVVVTGCAAQIDPAAFAAMPEVDLVLGNALKAAPEGYAEAAFARRVVTPEIMRSGLTAATAGSRLPSSRMRAFVEVQNGCDHRCTFCVIPFGRGASRSRRPEAVVEEIAGLAARGVGEVVLTGVDLTSYGEDLGEPIRLGDLVLRILRQVKTLPRLRLSSIDAAEIDAALLLALQEEPRLMPHLHLSLQSGSDMILKRMRRRHLRADALRLVEAVRQARPETAFGADLIAGFPTESEAMFEDTLQLVREAGLAYVHVFPFSPRPGTPAARMPPVAREAVKERAARLRAAAGAALERHLQGRVGSRAMGLVEAEGRARAEDFTEIAFVGDARAGEILSFDITGRVGGRAAAIASAPGHGDVTHIG